MGFCAVNPSHPGHKIKQWIDKAALGNPNYYALHFTLDDNPFVDDDYKNRIRDSLSGLFYKRNYLGLWCLAEGAVFDFFDRSIHVVKKPPASAEYWVVGIDYGTTNNFACVLMGVNTGHRTQTGVKRWFEKEYVWDSKARGRQKTNFEYANDVQAFIEPYGVKAVYIDPSAASFRLELQRRGIHVVDADNDVLPGLTYMTSEMAKGSLFVCDTCPYLIKELEGYVWDIKASEKGEDEPHKKDDHCIDAARYAFYTHKVASYNPYVQAHNPEEYKSGRFTPGPRRF
jgi:PBSX family phage terminase large subunit